MSSATIITKYLPGENLLGARVTATAKKRVCNRCVESPANGGSKPRQRGQTASGKKRAARPNNGQAAVYVQINRHSTPAFIVAPAEQNSLKLVPR
jgi:hypothetical protein